VSTIIRPGFGKSSEARRGRIASGAWGNRRCTLDRERTKTIENYRRAQHERRPLSDSQANTDFEQQLERAASDAYGIYDVICGDGEPALLMLAPARVTVVRLNSENQFEATSVGLAGGRLVEVRAIVESPVDPTRHLEFTYANPALETVGGAVTLTATYMSEPEAAKARLQLSGLLVAPVRVL
jgi:hypothetical protein